MIGQTLSHYKIESELGRGGMGIVYKATDTKLNRTVALKVLPAAALSSEDDRARFFREAQAAAQLTHAHIATVYEIDEAVVFDEKGNEQNASDGPRPFIAMEYIEGDTLEDRIKQSPLKLEDAVRLATEIADALKAAHAKEIVHRDIKSANVMMSSDGKAKVLDFGLAKTTHSTMLTQMGSTLGTVAFMSPEQARGEEVDSRTDLYSLGTILFEMVAGRRPFAGEYEQAVVYGILNEAPEPLTALRSGVPMNLEWIVNKCLAKKADDRYQTASDLIVDLRNLDLSSSGASSVSTASMASVTTFQPSGVAQPIAQIQEKRSMIPMIGVAAATLLVGLAAGFMVFRTSPEPKPLLRVSIELPGLQQVRFPIISPTREYMALTGVDRGGNSGVFLRDMASGELRHIEGTEGAGDREIMFSPDGTRLAYTNGANQGVYTVVVPTGLPERQTETGRISFWESSTSFVFVDDQPGGETYRKSLGESETSLISLDHGELLESYTNVWKTRIPGSKVVFGHRLSRGGNVQAETSWLVRAQLEDGQTVEPVESPIMNPEYVHGGFLVYQQRNDSGTLVVRPVDPQSGDFLGPPTEALSGESTAWAGFSVSAFGDLIYIPFAMAPVSSSDQLYFVDLEKNEANGVQLVVPGGSQVDDVVFSPRGDLLALTITVSNEAYLAIYDFADESLTQITFGEDTGRPAWSNDGDWIYYDVFSDSVAAIHRKRPDASSVSELVVSNARSASLSPNGRFMSFTRGRPGEDQDLMLFEFESQDIVPIDTSTGMQVASEFSPDGQYIVYENRTGGFNLRVASIDGLRTFDLPNVQGRDPRWSADGNHIYVSGGVNVKIPVRTSPSFNVLGDEIPLFTTGGTFGFDISPDEKTIAIVSGAILFNTDAEATSNVVWLQNWSDHLKREFEK